MTLAALLEELKEDVARFGKMIIIDAEITIVIDCSL